MDAIKEKLTRDRKDGRGTKKPTKPKTPEEIAAFEKRKVSGAIRTDFILSAEIIVITLNIVADASLLQQILTLIIIAIVMTIGVYGLVAGIVRMDDAGLALEKSNAQGAWGIIVRRLGGVLLSAAPILMKSLSWIGTIAMFLVGGAFVTDGIEPLTHFVDGLVESARDWELAVTWGVHCVIGALVGMTAVALVKIFSTISDQAIH